MRNRFIATKIMRFICTKPRQEVETRGKMRKYGCFMRSSYANIWKSSLTDIIFALRQKFNEGQLGPFNTKPHTFLCWMPKLDTPATSSSDCFSLEKKLKLAITTAETQTRMSKSSQPSTISPITMVMIPQEEWQLLNDKLDRLAEMIENRNATDRDAEWLESEAARKLLGVSPKTWQNYRDQRVIPFSQIGRKIYVNRADLNAFLRCHRIG